MKTNTTNGSASHSAHKRPGWRAVLVIAAVICGCNAASGQTDWTRQATYPTLQDLDGAVFLSPDHGFVVGRGQTLLETKDAGETWRVIKSGKLGSEPFYAVAFPDELHGYITGNNNDAWRTVDGGETWQQMSNIPAGSWHNLDFLSPTVGFAGANGALVFTPDGGTSWQIQSAYPECPVIYGMDFRDVNLGLVAGNQLSGGGGIGIYRTTDGGQDWTKVSSETINDVQFLTANVALATAVLERKIYLSTDAGLTWAPFTPPFKDDGPLNDLERLTASRVVATSDAGDVWLSIDGGEHWEKKLEPLGDLPYDWNVQFSDALNGAVTGPHGILYTTSDGGETWTLLTNGIGMRNEDIEMYDDLFGYGVSTNGYIVRTKDSGHHWELQKVEVTGKTFQRDEDLRCIDIVDADVAVVAGAGGTVFRTLDGGDEWESIGYPELPGDFSIEDIHFLNASEGWVVGWDLDPPRDQSIYHTTNGGLTWTNPFRLPTIWERVHFMDSQHGIIMGTGGIYLYTEDGGKNWTEGSLPDWKHGSPTIVDMVFPDPLHGWAVGWWGYYAKTSDGGKTWEQLDMGDNVRVGLGIEARDENEAWIVALDDSMKRIILHTKNGGSTWLRERSPSTDVEVPSQITRTASGRMWIGGDQGSIWASDPLPPGSISLTASKIQRGERATFRVTNALSEDVVYFLYSLKGIGVGPCVPFFGGLCVDLLKPVKLIGKAQANAGGTAEISVIVPGKAPLVLIYLQAVARRGAGGADSVKSNTVSAQIEP